jgi:predicted nucleic acid-binding protein
LAYLVDTNILLRSLQPAHPMYERAVRCVETLLNRGETVYFCPQNVREFWNVCTRPAENNGLGMTPAQVVGEVKNLTSTLTFLPDSPAVYTEWLRLVEVHSVSGVQVHDTNLVAVMNVGGITHFLTFNSAHFRRFTGITVVEP